ITSASRARLGPRDSGRARLNALRRPAVPKRRAKDERDGGNGALRAAQAHPDHPQPCAAGVGDNTLYPIEHGNNRKPRFIDYLKKRSAEKAFAAVARSLQPRSCPLRRIRFSNVKSSRYDNGVAYVTSHRILFVHAVNPTERSVAVYLTDVQALDTYKGFLKSSPKLTVWTAGSGAGGSTSPGNAPRANAGAPVGAAAAAAAAPWVCPICSEANAASLMNCRLCGVKRDDEDEARAPPKSGRHRVDAAPAPPSTPAGAACGRCSFLNAKGAAACEMCDAALPPGGGASSVAACPRCSFHNDPSAARCTMCEGEMPPFQRPHEDGPASPFSPGSASEVVSPSGSFQQVQPALELSKSFVKIAFRGGGMAPFAAAVKAALAARAWETMLSVAAPPPATAHFNPLRTGITGIVRNVEETGQRTDESINDAFRDLDGLIAKAADMVRGILRLPAVGGACCGAADKNKMQVKLAEQISAKISAGGAAAEGGYVSAEDVANFKSFLLDLGVASPVTK
ncbi:MAG: hypothetical protein BJ554DRAFT_244, partial [Olpidium bornovanus]